MNQKITFCSVYLGIVVFFIKSHFNRKATDISLLYPLGLKNKKLPKRINHFGSSKHSITYLSLFHNN